MEHQTEQRTAEKSGSAAPVMVGILHGNCAAKIHVQGGATEVWNRRSIPTHHAGHWGAAPRRRGRFQHTESGIALQSLKNGR
jgi:hypothetical protein